MLSGSARQHFATGLSAVIGLFRSLKASVASLLYGKSTPKARLAEEEPVVEEHFWRTLL